MTPVDRISMAIKRIQEKGWYQGGWQSDQRGCLVRSLYTDLEFAEKIALIGNSYWAIEEVCKELNLTLNTPSSSAQYGAVTWNDAPYRTETEVLALLETTRDRLLAEKREREAMAAIDQEFAHELIPVSVMELVTCAAI